MIRTICALLLHQCVHFIQQCIITIIFMYYLERKYVREYLKTLSFVILCDMKENRIQNLYETANSRTTMTKIKCKNAFFLPYFLPISFSPCFLYVSSSYKHFLPFKMLESKRKKAMMMMVRMMIMIVWKHFPCTKPQKQQHKHNRFHRRVIIIFICRSNRTVSLDNMSYKYYIHGSWKMK